MEWGRICEEEDIALYIIFRHGDKAPALARRRLFPNLENPLDIQIVPVGFESSAPGGSG